MWVVRPAAIADLASLSELTASLGPGMTTLPSGREAMAAKIDFSARSFAGQAAVEERQYFLVLEDSDTGAILGTAAVYPRIGVPFGFFSYRVNRTIQHSRSLGRTIEVELLELTNDYTGLTEVGALAVKPELRRSGAGRLLAQSRYILMSAFPDLFADRVIAEMRGWQGPNGDSPFWTAVGKRFFKMSFASADHLSAVSGAGFIADLLPRHPLYVDLLPKRARDVVGRPHSSSALAMRMLAKEGFRYDGHVDVFDAGPQMIAARMEIDTIARARRGVMPLGNSKGTDSPCLVATGALESFRVVKGATRVSDEGVGLDPAVRSALGEGADASLTIVQERVEA